MKIIRNILIEWADAIKNKKLNLMTDEELCYINIPACHNKEEEIFLQTKLIEQGAIPLHLLETGKTYIGFCRNASEAVWLGDKFEYMRTKFGSTFTEKINHFQNDDGYDVFVPVKVKK